MNSSWLGIEVPACPEGPTWCYLLSAGAQSVGRKAASDGIILVPMPAAVENPQALITARSLIPGICFIGKTPVSRFRQKW